jgi:hypothetical protein
MPSGVFPRTDEYRASVSRGQRRRYDADPSARDKASRAARQAFVDRPELRSLAGARGRANLRQDTDPEAFADLCRRGGLTTGSYAWRCDDCGRVIVGNAGMSMHLKHSGHVGRTLIDDFNEGDR